MYIGAFAAWFPHYLYLRGVSRKIHKIYLMRGGKYCRVVINEYGGEQMNTWITIRDLKLLNKEMDRFNDEYEFLDKTGQL